MKGVGGAYCWKDAEKECKKKAKIATDDALLGVKGVYPHPTLGSLDWVVNGSGDTLGKVTKMKSGDYYVKCGISGHRGCKPGMVSSIRIPEVKIKALQWLVDVQNRTMFPDSTTIELFIISKVLLRLVRPMPCETRILELFNMAIN